MTEVRWADKVAFLFLFLVAGWVAWIGLDLLEVSIAYAEGRLACHIAIYGFAIDWAWLRWIPGTVGIVLLSRSVLSGGGDLQRVKRLAQLTLAFVGLRLISLIPVVGVIFPPVGFFWTPHLSWALSFTVALYLGYPGLQALALGRARAVGYGILVAFSVLFILYGIFYIRTTLLHGDEPQYLTITQSLIRDGDINLANTQPDDNLEYHQVSFSPHRAPASPEGKLHSTHPMGIAALTAPAYWLGLRFLDHPRLTVALSISLLSALAVFLLYVLLRKADFDVIVSAVVSGIAGTSPLLFLYSNQIYPDVAALVFTLPTLILSFEKRKNSSRVAFWACAIMALLLPILHPRLLPLTLLLGWMLWRKAVGHPLRNELVRACLVFSGIALVGYVSYHFHYTGDIWGAYKPGNAWKAWAFSPGGTAFGLVGQWLDLRVGLLNNAPVFGFVIPGLVLLFRDRRNLCVAVVLVYATTACVNANSDDWRFGYCYAGRFMITALPALVLPLAVIFQRGLTRDPLILVLLFLATAIGLDTVFEAIRLTEAAFLGNQLIDRSIATLYPLGVHFPRLENLAKFPWQDIFFWVPLAAGSLILTHLALRRRIAVSSGFLLVLLAVSASGTKYPSRLRDQVSARLETYDEDVLGRKVRMIEKRARFNETTGVTREDGYYVARDSQLSAGIVGYSGLPNIVASIYGIALPAVGSPSTDGMPTGYYVVGERTSVRAYGNHEIRWAIPVTGDGQVGFQRFVRTAGKHPTYQFMTFSGEGSMSFGDTKIMINPLRIREENTLLSRGDLNLPNEGERDFNLSIEAPDLDPGFYRFSVTVEDVDPTVWFVRRADPIMFVVYAADTAAGKRKFRKWVPMLGKAMEAIPPKGLERPLVEAYLAPHWAMIPILGDDKMQFEFENDRKQTIYVGGIYSGEYNLRLRSISLEQRTFQTWEAGELKPLHLPSKPFGLP